MTDVAVVADDLSGAVEAAAAFLLRTSRISVAVDGRPGSGTATVQVLDTHSRGLPPEAAGSRVRAVLDQLEDVALVVKKIDSLLRGNLAAELIAAAALRPAMVVAPALPAAGRTVRAGVVWVDGVPLTETDAWRAEARSLPATVAAALAPLPTRTLDLDVVRGRDLAGQLRAARLAGLVPVCDALTDDDLDLVVTAGRTLERPLLVGSAGLAAAVARSLPAEEPAAAAPSGSGPARTSPAATTVVVVGSAAVNIPGQLVALQGVADRVVLVQPDRLVDEQAGVAVRAQIGAPTGGVTVVAVDPRAVVQPRYAAAVAAGLARVVAEVAGAADALVLTGGETARAVLDRLDVTELRPLVQVHHGAVISAGSTGQLIATRPGSFGGPDSLLTLVQAVSTVDTSHVKELA